MCINRYKTLLLLRNVLHRHFALIESRVVAHAISDAFEVIISCETKQVVAAQVIQEEGMDAHTMEGANVVGYWTFDLLARQR